MTNEEYIEIAVAAGIIPWTKHEHIGGNNFSASDEGLDGDLASLIQFAKLVAAKERETCAKLVESFQRDHIYTADLAGAIGAIKHKLADAIRARGEA